MKQFLLLAQNYQLKQRKYVLSQQQNYKITLKNILSLQAKYLIFHILKDKKQLNLKFLLPLFLHQNI
jgi:hypothetical protein